MKSETLTRIENLKANDILTSDIVDTAIVLDNRNGYCEVVECDYSEENQMYTPTDRIRRLTYSEIARDYDI